MRDVFIDESEICDPDPSSEITVSLTGISNGSTANFIGSIITDCPTGIDDNYPILTLVVNNITIGEYTSLPASVTIASKTLNLSGTLTNFNISPEVGDDAPYIIAARLTAKDKCGNEASNVASVIAEAKIFTLKEPPKAAFTCVDKSDGEYDLDASTSQLRSCEGGSLSYRWELRDASDNSLLVENVDFEFLSGDEFNETPTVEFKKSGTYLVTLGVKSECGFDSITKTVRYLSEDIIVVPKVCSITNIFVWTQTKCSPSAAKYKQQLIITYENPPESGTLNVNSQSFTITSSPQTIELTDLDSDGELVNVTAVFSAGTDCRLTKSNLFRAPLPCQTPLEIRPVITTQATDPALSSGVSSIAGEIRVNGTETTKQPPAPGLMLEITVELDGNVIAKPTFDYSAQINFANDAPLQDLGYRFARNDFSLANFDWANSLIFAIDPTDGVSASGDLILTFDKLTFATDNNLLDTKNEFFEGYQENYEQMSISFRILRGSEKSVVAKTTIPKGVEHPDTNHIFHYQALDANRAVASTFTNNSIYYIDRTKGDNFGIVHMTSGTPFGLFGDNRASIVNTNGGLPIIYFVKSANPRGLYKLEYDIGNKDFSETRVFDGGALGCMRYLVHTGFYESGEPSFWVGMEYDTDSGENKHGLALLYSNSGTWTIVDFRSMCRVDNLFEEVLGVDVDSLGNIWFAQQRTGQFNRCELRKAEYLSGDYKDPINYTARLWGGQPDGVAIPNAGIASATLGDDLELHNVESILVLDDTPGSEEILLLSFGFDQGEDGVLLLGEGNGSSDSDYRRRFDFTKKLHDTNKIGFGRGLQLDPTDSGYVFLTSAPGSDPSSLVQRIKLSDYSVSQIFKRDAQNPNTDTIIY